MIDVIECLTTKYGNPSGLYQYYRFAVDLCVQTANGNKYWVCSRHDIKCRSTLTPDVTGEFVMSSGEYRVYNPARHCTVCTSERYCFNAELRNHARGEPNL